MHLSDGLLSLKYYYYYYYRFVFPKTLPAWLYFNQKNKTTKKALILTGSLVNNIRFKISKSIAIYCWRWTSYAVFLFFSKSLDLWILLDLEPKNADCWVVKNLTTHFIVLLNTSLSQSRISTTYTVQKTSTTHYTFVLHAHKNCLYICHVV